MIDQGVHCECFEPAVLRTERLKTLLWVFEQLGSIVLTPPSLCTSLSKRIGVAKAAVFWGLRRSRSRKLRLAWRNLHLAETAGHKTRDVGTALQYSLTAIGRQFHCTCIVLRGRNLFLKGVPFDRT